MRYSGKLGDELDSSSVGSFGACCQALGANLCMFRLVPLRERSYEESGMDRWIEIVEVYYRY
jgi:hypothetical protein